MPGLSGRAPVPRAGRRPPSAHGGKAAASPREELADIITELTERMHTAAAELHFEVAARFRDEIRELKQELRGMHAAGV